MLQTSAKGAAAQCSGGASGTVCGNDWGNSTWDGSSGLGQDLSALNIFLANLPQGALANSSANATAIAAGNSSTTGTSSPGAASNTSSRQPASYTNGASGMAASSFALMAAIGFAVAFCL
jgi:mannan endo-1,6-alpha-mannosidase